MKQILNGFDERYYLTSGGRLYDSITERYKSFDNASHSLKLKRQDGKSKSISLKRLYRLVFDQPYSIDNVPDLTNEEWREVANTDGNYLVSSGGRIKSKMGYETILMKPTINRSGYERVDIFYSGYRISKLVSRLVADAFLLQPARADMQLHHINGIKTDNNAVNLVWMTPEEHLKLHKKSIKEANRVPLK